MTRLRQQTGWPVDYWRDAERECRAMRVARTARALANGWQPTFPDGDDARDFREAEANRAYYAGVTRA